jgi:YggT family protein
MMAIVVSVIHTVVSLYSLALIGRVFLEMVLGAYHPVVAFLRKITEPVLVPIRRAIPSIQSGGMAWDLSPMVALFILWIVEQVLTRVLLSLAR